MDLFSPESFLNMDMETDPCEIEIKTDEYSDITEKKEYHEIELNELVLPQNYREIYESYKNKNYRECLFLLDNVDTNFVQYRIIKSACLIHLTDEKDNISKAHETLDEVLENDPNNAYVLYAKGLAYYVQMKWDDSIKFFDKSINMDPDNMERAELLRERAQDRLDEKQRINKSQAAMVSRKSFSGGVEIMRRFGCELCGHFFGKKYNLDRHNRAIHRRDTPFSFPSKPLVTRRETESVSPTKLNDNIKTEAEDGENNQISITSPSVKQNKSKKGKTNPPVEVMIKGKDKAKCKVCKKVYKRNSIARHMIIHTGRKQYECTICERAFFQKSDLMRHEVRKLLSIYLHILYFYFTRISDCSQRRNGIRMYC